MKKFIFLSIVVLAGGAYLLVQARNTEKEQQDAIAKVKLDNYTIDFTNEYIAQVNDAVTITQLDDLERKLPYIWPEWNDSDSQKKVKATLSLKKAKVQFLEAEALLKQAIDLQNALTLPPLPPDPPMPTTDSTGHGYNAAQTLPREPPPPPIHPAAKEALEKAEKLYVSSKKQIDKLNDIPGDKDYNFSLNYTKGEIYHRHLLFLSTPENQQELLIQTATYYKKALGLKPGDTNTVINIELLLKQSQGGGQQQVSQPQRMLNQMGVGKSKGN